jgi:Na+-driven multidrug efflux pump
MMLQPFLSIAIWFFFFLAVERLGERSLAVVNLIRTLSALPFIIIHACATTANSLISNLIGEGKSNLVWRLIGKILCSAFVIVVPMLIFFALCPELVLRIYTDNTALIADSINITYVMCIASFIQIGAFILFNSVSGTGAVKMTVFIEIINLAIYTVFVWFIIIKHHPTPAQAWTVEIAYQSVTIIFCALYMLSGKWRNSKL